VAEPDFEHGPRASLLLVPLLFTALGCDIVQGFQDAGNTLFPEQSTHLSSPAIRLVSGGYTSLDLAAGRELSVLARATESDTSLFVMRFANPKPCEIPRVGRYVASRDPNRAEAGIAYFHENVLQGTLHFADTSCKTFELELEDARLPVGETERSVIVWAGGDLLEVDPVKNERKTLASLVTNLVPRGFSGRTFVVSNGQLEVFDSRWKSHGRFGSGVTSIIRTQTGALYLDSAGLHRLSAGPENASTDDELIIADACNLGMRDDTWATFHSPCAAQRLHALREPSGELYELDLGENADPIYLRLLPARGSPGKDPLADPFWFVFLRDTATLSTLVVRDPEGGEHVIGDQATLRFFNLEDSDSHRAPFGQAMINVRDNTADYIYFDTDGERRTLAQNVYTRADRLLVDWNGSTGSLAVSSGDRLAIVAERVPDAPFEFADDSGAWTVLFHDWTGEAGRLSRIPTTIDALARTPIKAPFEIPELTEVAPEVGIWTTSSFSKLIPGTIFLADYNPTSGTGRLTYENSELRFKAVVDSGVSSYLFTRDYLMYTIPEGRDRGIWLATGK
jgi:hypothetical protein